MVSLARHTSGTDLFENFRRAVYIPGKYWIMMLWTVEYLCKQCWAIHWHTFINHQLWLMFDRNKLILNNDTQLMPYMYNGISATPSDSWKVDSPTLSYMLHRRKTPDSMVFSVSHALHAARSVACGLFVLPHGGGLMEPPQHMYGSTP